MLCCMSIPPISRRADLVYCRWVYCQYKSWSICKKYVFVQRKKNIFIMLGNVCFELNWVFANLTYKMVSYTEPPTNSSLETVLKQNNKLVWPTMVQPQTQSLTRGKTDSLEILRIQLPNQVQRNQTDTGLFHLWKCRSVSIHFTPLKPNIR